MNPQVGQLSRGSILPKSVKTQPTVSPTTEFMPQAGEDFVSTPYVQDLTKRALTYLEIGYAVHLSGPAGTGKTTLALHIASQLGRRCTLLHGDDEFKGSDLLGRDTGYRKNSVVDNYVSSIVKTEETMSVVWSSNRLTTACEQGHTLIYDEFTRSPAAANNAFLSILEEGILNIPSSGKEKGYIKVHPDFRAIFTSNPEEYVGVHKTQDALLDRMITLELGHQDRETEISIVVAKSKRSVEDASLIVDIIREIRTIVGENAGPTIRAALAIAKIATQRQCRVSASDPVFIVTCHDVLLYNLLRQKTVAFDREMLDAIIRRVVGSVGDGTKPNVITPPSIGDVTTIAKSPSVEMHDRIDSFQSENVLHRNEPATVLSSVTRNNWDSAGRDIVEEINELSETLRPNRYLHNIPFSVNSLSDSLPSVDTDYENESAIAVGIRRLPRPPIFEPAIES